MASILDEYEDSLSRSTVLQPGCPSVGIPHSGKGSEGAAAPLGCPGICMGGAEQVAPGARVHLLDLQSGFRPLVLLRFLWPLGGGWSKFLRAASTAA